MHSAEERRAAREMDISPSRKSNGNRTIRPQNARGRRSTPLAPGCLPPLLLGRIFRFHIPAAWPASREVGEDLEEDGDEYVVNALQGWPRTFTQPMRRPDYLRYGAFIGNGGIPTDFLPGIEAGLVGTRPTLNGCNEDSCFDDDEDLFIDPASLERSFWAGFLLLVFLSYDSGARVPDLASRTSLKPSMTVIHTVSWKAREGDAAAAALLPACSAAVKSLVDAGIDGVEK
ncbi:hypothetical protein HK405_010691, partial [Cladochytrium tenue]